MFSFLSVQFNWNHQQQRQQQQKNSLLNDNQLSGAIPTVLLTLPLNYYL